MEKPVYLGFAVLELSIFLIYETFMTNYNHYLDRKTFNYLI